VRLCPSPKPQFHAPIVTSSSASASLSSTARARSYHEPCT
jgi:hypothetical protein